MRFRLRLGILLLATAISCLAFSQGGEFQQGEVLVGYRSAARIFLSQGAHRAIGAQVEDRNTALNVERVKLPSGMDVIDAVSYYASQPNVDYAEPNYKRQLDYTPNDASFGSQYGPVKVKCKEAWNLCKGRSSVVIAVIDAGIDMNHPDLKGKLVQGTDIGSGDSNPSSTEPHGSHTAGIAAAQTDNATGIAGAGFNCRIMPIKIAPHIDASHSAQGMTWAADHGAKVISMSYGGSGFSVTEMNAANYAWSKGVVLVAAAGNQGSNNKLYPAAYDPVISVGSTGQDDSRSSFSNFGADVVDVAAPGEDILSTIPGGYGEMSGTSMACPLVAGVVGLLWSFAAPETTNQQIRTALESNCDPIGDWLQFGRVNAYKALQSLDTGTENVSTPTSVSMWTGTNPAGGLSDILTSDANAFKVGSNLFPGGQIAGAEVTIGFQGAPTNLRLSQVTLDSNGPNGASSFLFLWNFQSGVYDQIRATALRATGTNRIKVTLPSNLKPYVSAGVMKVGLRAIVPRRPGTKPPSAFDYRLNFIEVRTRPG